MRYHGLYYISNPGAQLPASLEFVNAIVAGIESNFPRADTAGGWTLNHRILRENPPYSEEATSGYTHAYQHLLHASTISPDRTYNLIQHPSRSSQNGVTTQNGAATQVAIASMPLSNTDAHFSLLANQMALLWSPQRMLDANGKTYRVGYFLVYLGELRSRRQTQTANITSPGVVVCISTHVGGPDVEAETSPFPADGGALDFGKAQKSIRELWNTIQRDVVLGRSEVREFMQAAQDFDGDEEQAREAVVRMWCEALGPRA